MKLLITSTFLILCITMNTKYKIYKGNSTSYSNCLFTFKEQKVYQGNSTSYSDCIISIQGEFNKAVIAVLIGPY